jgi:hypothetical protein
MYGILLGSNKRMKARKLLLALVFSVGFLSEYDAVAQSPVIDQINEAFKAGSAKELSKYLHQTVDVTIEGKLGNYSKAQAEIVLRDFFKTYPPSEFSIIHQGSSKGGQPFAIGKYVSGGANYRVWMKLKVVDKEQVIQEISLVKD